MTNETVHKVSHPGPSSRSSALSFLVLSLGSLQTVQFLGLLDLLEDCAAVDASCARTSNTAKTQLIVIMIMINK